MSIRPDRSLQNALTPAPPSGPCTPAPDGFHHQCQHGEQHVRQRSVLEFRLASSRPSKAALCRKATSMLARLRQQSVRPRGSAWPLALGWKVLSSREPVSTSHESAPGARSRMWRALESVPVLPRRTDRESRLRSLAAPVLPRFSHSDGNVRMRRDLMVAGSAPVATLSPVDVGSGRPITRGCQASRANEHSSPADVLLF